MTTGMLPLGRRSARPDMQWDFWTLWEQVLSATDQRHMVGNLVAHLEAGVRRDIIDRVLEYWRSVHPEISAGIARGLGVPMNPAA